MVEDIDSLMRNDTIMFEYEVHDMRRAVKLYKEILGLKVIFEGGEYHTEFALPVKSTRLALSLTEKPRKNGRSPSRLFIVTDDIYAVEASPTRHSEGKLFKFQSSSRNFQGSSASMV